MVNVMLDYNINDMKTFPTDEQVTTFTSCKYATQTILHWSKKNIDQTKVFNKTYGTNLEIIK